MNTLIAKPFVDGYTWTLTSRLGHMLMEAQKRFGDRDINFTILGIEFEEDGPQIWYPGNCDHIIIQLTPDTFQDMVKGCYQLAHECIHLLSPTGGRSANTLEEGLATHFAFEYVKTHFNREILATIKSYEFAQNLVSRLLKLDSDAIRNLRVEEPVISQITAQQILKHYPSIGEEVANALEAGFNR